MTNSFLGVTFAGCFGALSTAGCTLDRTPAPPLAGPSESALSLVLTATPDLIPQDGRASSLVEVLARDASGAPVRNLTVEAETFVNGTRMDFGSLSSRTVATSRDGRASITYYAPAPPAASAIDDVTVAVVMRPIGTNYAAAAGRVVLIRLVRPGIVLPPNRPPVPAFFFSPATPREGDSVGFDATGSSDDSAVVSFAWSFGDGGTGSGSRTTHRYQVAGTYNVVLTVTDDRGATAMTAPTPVVVTTVADPVASFTLSPSEPIVGQEVIANASGSKAAPGRTITSFVWDYGDGSPPGSGAIPGTSTPRPGLLSLC